MLGWLALLTQFTLYCAFTIRIYYQFIVQANIFDNVCISFSEEMLRSYWRQYQRTASKAMPVISTLPSIRCTF